MAEDFVVCQLCNEKFKTLTTNHLKKAHDTTMQEYRECFPDAEIVSKESSRKAGESIMKTHQIRKAIIDSVLSKEDSIKDEIISDVEKNTEEIIDSEDREIVDRLKRLSEEKAKEVEIPKTNEEKVVNRVKEIRKTLTIVKKFINADSFKHVILLGLVDIFGESVENNYQIQYKNNQGYVEDFYYTDISILDKKIALYFKNAFWHNDYNLSSSGVKKLNSSGWTIVVFEEKHPTIEDVKKKLKTLNLF